MEANHTDTLRMLALQLNGHPRAQDFEPTGHGGSDPTAISGTVNDSAAQDGKRYTRAIERAWNALREADDIRRHQTAAEIPKTDPHDLRLHYCTLHWRLEIVNATTERYRLDLCRSCYERKLTVGDYPTLDDVRYHHSHGRWPRKLVDPKTHVPNMSTRRIAGLDNLIEGATTIQEAQ